MGLSRQYQTYSVVHLNHYDITWAGIAYNKILVKDFPSEYLVTEDYTCDVSHTAEFLYPVSVLNKYYLDGLAEGMFSIYNESTTTAYDVTAYVINIKKSPDVGGGDETLGTYSNTISSDNSVPTEDYLSLPIYINIDHKLVEEDERLLLEVSYTCAGDTLGDTGIAHANDRTNADGYIKIPYAPEG